MRHIITQGHRISEYCVSNNNQLFVQENVESDFYARHQPSVMPEATKLAINRKVLRDQKFDYYSEGTMKKCGNGSKIPTGKEF